MAIVTAGVHFTVVDRAILELVLFLYLERIHVGAQAEHALTATFAEHADDAGITDTGMHLEPEFIEQFGDACGGALFFEGEFGVAVDIMPPCLHAGLQGRGM